MLFSWTFVCLATTFGYCQQSDKPPLADVLIGDSQADFNTNHNQFYKGWYYSFADENENIYFGIYDADSAKYHDPGSDASISGQNAFTFKNSTSSVTPAVVFSIPQRYNQTTLIVRFEFKLQLGFASSSDCKAQDGVQIAAVVVSAPVDNVETDNPRLLLADTMECGIDQVVDTAVIVTTNSIHKHMILNFKGTTIADCNALSYRWRIWTSKSAVPPFPSDVLFDSVVYHDFYRQIQGFMGVWSGFQISNSEVAFPSLTPVGNMGNCWFVGCDPIETYWCGQKGKTSTLAPLMLRFDFGDTMDVVMELHWSLDSSNQTCQLGHFVRVVAEMRSSSRPQQPLFNSMLNSSSVQSTMIPWSARNKDQLAVVFQPGSDVSCNFVEFSLVVRRAPTTTTTTLATTTTPTKSTTTTTKASTPLQTPTVPQTATKVPTTIASTPKPSSTTLSRSTLTSDVQLGTTHSSSPSQSTTITPSSSTSHDVTTTTTTTTLSSSSSSSSSSTNNIQVDDRSPTSDNALLIPILAGVGAFLAIISIGSILIFILLRDKTNDEDDSNTSTAEYDNVSMKNVQIAPLESQQDDSQYSVIPSSLESEYSNTIITNDVTDQYQIGDIEKL